ncbi:response regulator transcription factor [Sinomicrobium weinanense]|uniref:Response regulator transcription factor n=1 Tax=Sinomicrobium weinanense TaxID=2842200 RepID=A0A926JPN6_9FLAO|nr:response regulator transcription factor [Sinomicrobium weinanense]MBC9795182.1 response regulator transcription factor [Sinomicrobium weinanense]MBU3121959.1 response regulator transcription factor [Sinomicrobium weinanense]
MKKHESTNNPAKILLVEDDTSLGYLLTEYLKMKDFQVVWAKNGKEGLEQVEKYPFELCIIDVMMPEMDGFTLAGHIQRDYPETPFLFLTARSLKIDVLKGFALGAVDYLKKPIDEEELVVRIKNLLSRMGGAEEASQKQDKYVLGGYIYFPGKLQLIYGEEVTQLTSRENELLAYLVKNKNKLCRHKDILTLMWGKNDYFSRKSLNVFISRLRKYLSKEASIQIDNIHNQGFLLRVGE